MIDFPGINEICTPTKSKILMLVVDGLGGSVDQAKGGSELELANIPNYQKMAKSAK